MSVFPFWSQQDSNPRPGYYHGDVLPLRHFDPPISLCKKVIENLRCNDVTLEVIMKSKIKMISKFDYFSLVGQGWPLFSKTFMFDD